MRVVQGIASAPLETLVTSTVSDLFYTAWKTQRISKPLPPRPDEKAEHNNSTVEIVALDSKRTPYIKRLPLFSGRLSSASFWKGVIKPIPLIIYPAVLYGTLNQGIAFTALITQGLLYNTIFSQPPYSLSPAQVGLTNIPLMICGLISAPLAGFLADFLAKSLSRRNNGVFEPEFRLLLQIIATPLTVASFVGTGFAVANQAPLWVLLVMGSLEAISVPFVAQAALTYVIDCHPRDANQAFVTINFFKAVMTFLATGSANGLMFRMGPKPFWFSVAAIALVTNLLTVPAYVFGKRFRSWVARSKVAQKIA
ncbi:MAG: hypothetical protein Q9227_002187 [Pyrenula ochraceoflavens]